LSRSPNNSTLCHFSVLASLAIFSYGYLAGAGGTATESTEVSRTCESLLFLKTALSLRASKIKPTLAFVSGRINAAEINPGLAQWEDALPKIDGDSISVESSVSREGVFDLGSLTIQTPESPKMTFRLNGTGLQFAAKSSSSGELKIRLWFDRRSYAPFMQTEVPDYLEAKTSLDETGKVVDLSFADFTPYQGDRVLDRVSPRVASKFNVSGISHMQFLIIPSEHARPEKIQLTLIGPLVVSRQLMPEYISTLHVKFPWKSSVFSSGPEFDEQIDRTVQKAAQNVMNSVYQKRAVQIVNQGGELLKKVLRSRGFGTTVIRGKLEDGEFFGSLYNSGSPAIPKIPIETGYFGADHGENAHVAQLIAMTEEMSTAQLENMHVFFMAMGFARPENWSLWDMLFDAPIGPNSPRWWKPFLINPSHF
jgi:hypothetical protein